ncbi:MAG: TonB-dependent receptor [Pseudomonadota bacterium]
MKRHSNLFVSGCLLLTAAPAATFAQDQSDDVFVIEEIVVTAQKREERVFDVPLSVTAMTGDEIAERGITNLLDAQYAVSGLTLTEFGPGQQRAQLRGTGTAGGATGLATVGFYIDEVPLVANAGGAGPDIRLLDMARIEVLRGPQPTLYGEGSMGGTIRYITADPELTEFSGNVGASFGSVTDGSESWRGQAVVNIPLIENELGVRFAVAEEQIGGWIDSVVDGRNDVNEADITTLRGKLLWQPNDRFTLRAMLLTQDLDQPYQNFGGPDRTTITGFPTGNLDEYDIFNLTASYEFDRFTVLGTVGYIDREASAIFDLTAFGVGFFTAPPEFGGFGLPPGLITRVGLTSDTEYEMWSQELRLTSNGDGPLNYNLGLYHRDPETDTNSVTITEPTAIQDLIGFDPFSGGPATNESDAFAVFGDVSYAFNEQWEVLLGVRYYEDERTQRTLAPTPRQAEFDTTNPRINVAWTPNDNSSYYANYAKGFRSGGFNVQIPGFNIPPDFGPEDFNSFEIGTKQIALDGRVSWELAAYYNDWTDIQVPAPAAAIPFFTNGGEASGPGVDFSLRALLGEEFTLGVTYGWTDMEYDTDTGDRNRGDSLDLVAERTGSISLDWARQISGGTELRARADYQHTSGFTLTVRRPPFNQVNPTDSRNVFNLRFGASFGDYEAYLFANNLTDDDGTLYPIIGTNLEPVLPIPRVIGAEFRVSF